MGVHDRADASAPVLSGERRYVVALVDILPDERDEGANALDEYVRAAGLAPGCVRIELAQQAGEMPNHFAVVSIWESDGARRAHVSSEVWRRFSAEVVPITASPIDERIYETPQAPTVSSTS